MKFSHIQRTIDAYDKKAEKYAHKFDNYEIYKNKISRFQRNYIDNGAHILDLGCGPANNIKSIFDLDKTCQFTGVDLSEKFISIANKRFPQFEFIRQDFRNIKIDKKFDIVLASFCIVHLSNEEAAGLLENISNLLSSHGYLYLSYMNGVNQGFKSTSFSKDRIFFNYFNDAFILDILKKTNFKVLEISKEDYLESDSSITTDTFIYAMKRQ